MDEQSLQSQILGTLAGSPAVKAAETKSFVERKRVPLEEAIPTTKPAETQVNPDEGTLFNSTQAAGGPVVQHINTGYPDSARLVSTGGDAYIGGSVSPNSSVRARIVEPDVDTGDDGFWLESTDRFAPVAEWTFTSPMLKKPVGITTTDPDKAAFQILTKYQGYPEENFFGYEYLPSDIPTQSWVSAALQGVAEGTANVIANTQHAIGSTEDMTPEERAEYNRAAGWFVRKAQEYLDKVNTRLPVYRSRGTDIAYGFGNAALSMTPGIVGTVVGGLPGSVIGGVISASLQAVDTLSTRDDVLAMGGTIEEAREAQLKHLGSITAIEVATGALGAKVTGSLVNAAIARGASKALSRVVGATALAGIGGVTDSFGEVLQDKIGHIVSGKEGMDSLMYFTTEDWNTFYSSLLFSAIAGGLGGSAIGGKRYTDVEKAHQAYYAKVAKLKETLMAKARARGVELPDAVVAALDDLINRITENPQGEFGSNVRPVAQGFLDMLLSLDPAAVEKAQQDLEAGTAQGLSEEKFAEFDRRIEEYFQQLKKAGTDLSAREQQLIHGLFRGMAYIGAYFYGQNPNDIVLPNLKKIPDDIATKAGTAGYYDFSEDTIAFAGDALYALGPYSPFDRFKRPGASKEHSVLATIVHEFSHLNDWRMSAADVENISEALDFYMQSIEEAFGEKKAAGVRKAAEAHIQAGEKPFNKTTEMSESDSQEGKVRTYTSKENITEWKAQAIESLRQNWDKYMGLSGKPAEYIKAVNAILKGLTDVAPVSEAISQYVKELQDFVQKNSNDILGFKESYPAQQMRAAISSYMSGNTVNWNGITNKTIEDFAQAVKKEANSEALAYIDEALKGIDSEDFVEKANREFKEAANIKDLPQEPTFDVGFTEELDPTEFLDELLENTGAPVQNRLIASDTPAGTQAVLSELSVAKAESKAPLTPFQKQTQREVAGHTLEEDIVGISDIIANAKKSRLGAPLSERRGLEGFLFSLGGEKLVKRFDFAIRRQAYDDMFTKKMMTFTQKFIKKHLGGSNMKYAVFMSNLVAKTISVRVHNPKNNFREETIFVSPDEVINAYFQYSQESNYGPARTKVVWMDTDIPALYNSLTPEQRAFGEMMRQDLKDEAQQSLASLGTQGFVRDNYFPFISWKAVHDDKPLQSYASMSRKNSLAPVGIVGATEVFGRYQARLMGARSGYFDAINRLKDIFDFKPNISGSMSHAEQELATKLAEQSLMLKQAAIDKLGAGGFNNMMDRIQFVRSGSIVKDIANSPTMKIARTMTVAMLGGKAKQFAVNATNFLLWFGAPNVRNTMGYYVEILKSMVNPKGSHDNAMRIGNGFFKNRVQQQSYSEFLKRGATPSEDVVFSDAAKFLHKKNLNRFGDFSAAAAYLSTVANKLGMLPTTIGDFVGNFVGADALQKTYYKQYVQDGYTPAQAMKMADDDVVRYVLYRQSSSNQAMKPLTILRWNQTNALMASFGQFTGESTAKGGQLGQDIQAVSMGEMSMKDAAKDITFILASQIGYLAIQTGLATIGIKALANMDIPDEEKEFVYDQIAINAVDSAISLAAGPYSSLISPLAQSIFTNHNYGLSIPLTTELLKTIEASKNIGKAIFTEEELDDRDIAAVAAMGFVATGILPSFINLYNTGKGAVLATSEDERERIKGRAMVAGRSEKYGEKKAGINTRKRSKSKEIR